MEELLGDKEYMLSLLSLITYTKQGKLTTQQAARVVEFDLESEVTESSCKFTDDVLNNWKKEHKNKALVQAVENDKKPKGVDEKRFPSEIGKSFDTLYRASTPDKVKKWVEITKT